MKIDYLIFWILLIGSVTIGVFFLVNDFRKQQEKGSGELVDAVVVKTPEICLGKGGHSITVRYLSKNYVMPITRGECRSNTYKKNQEIKVIFTKKENQLLWFDKNYFLSGLWLSLLLIVVFPAFIVYKFHN